MSRNKVKVKEVSMSIELEEDIRRKEGKWNDKYTHTEKLTSSSS